VAVDQAVVKIANERAVLTAVALNPGTFSAEIARTSGLGTQTVGKILDHLGARGLVRAGEVLRGRRGQPATPVFIDPDGAFVIGCELNLRHCIVQLIDLAGRVRGQRRWDFEAPEPQPIFAEIAGAVRELAGSLPAALAPRLSTIGVATPADFVTELERLGSPRAVAGRWLGIDIAARIGEITCLAPTRYGVGAAACWAELSQLPRPRPGKLAYFLVGRTIASGLVSAGRLVEGGDADVPDLGKMLVPDERGELTHLASVAGLAALQQRIRPADGRRLEGNAANWDWSALEPWVGEWLELASRGVAQVVADMVALVDSDLVVIDAAVPPPILRRYIASVERHLDTLPLSPQHRPMVQPGHCGDLAAANGAGKLLLFRTYFAGDWEYFAL